MDEQRDKWCNHPYYQKKVKSELMALCKQNGLSMLGAKHELVERLVLAEGGKEPQVHFFYNGDVKSLPSTTSSLGELTSGQLRSILRKHDLPTCGVKEELVIRILLLKFNKLSLCFHREKNALLDLVGMAKNVMYNEKRYDVVHEVTKIIRKRKFSTPEEQCLSSPRPRTAAKCTSRGKAQCSHPDTRGLQWR